MNLLNEDRKMIQRIFIRKNFELSHPGVDFGKVPKEVLAEYISQLENKIQNLRDPNQALTSKELVDAYLREASPPKLQRKLLRELANQEPKTKRELVQLLYRNKLHENKDNYVALRQLVSTTNEYIVREGSGDVFRIKGKKSTYWLSIDPTNLSIYLKKRSKKLTK